jgi:hypothetical protein
MVKIVTTPELPPPPRPKGATEWKEVARVWRAVDSKGAVFTGSIRTFSQAIEDWREPLAYLAQTAARAFTKFLPRPARQLGGDTLAYSLLRGAAAAHFDEIDEIVSEEESGFHPGQMEPPDLALVRPDSLEAISIWIAPDHECEGCGEVHKGGAFSGISTFEGFTAEALGLALGTAARDCAEMIVDTRGGSYDEVLMTIQTAMMREPERESGVPEPHEHKH